MTRKKQSIVLDLKLEVLLTDMEKPTVKVSIWTNPLKTVGFQVTLFNL